MSCAEMNKQIFNLEPDFKTRRLKETYQDLSGVENYLVDSLEFRRPDYSFDSSQQCVASQTSTASSLRPQVVACY